MTGLLLLILQDDSNVTLDDRRSSTAYHRQRHRISVHHQHFTTLQPLSRGKSLLIFDGLYTRWQHNLTTYFAYVSLFVLSLFSSWTFETV